MMQREVKSLRQVMIMKLEGLLLSYFRECLKSWNFFLVPDPSFGVIVCKGSSR